MYSNVTYGDILRRIIEQYNLALKYYTLLHNHIFI